MVSIFAYRASAQARQVVESCPPEKRTSALACMRCSEAGSLPIDDAGFGRLDLEREVLGVDPALRKAAGDEPEPRLRRALEHVAQLLAFAEPPDRADAFGHPGAEQPCDEVLLAFPPRGEHHEGGLFQQLCELVVLR